MSKLILPPGKSVVSEETQQKQIIEPLQKMRDSLFVGAIMAVADAAVASGNYPQQQTTEWVGNNPTPESLADEIVMRLAYAAQRNWNIASELLKINHRNLVDRHKGEIDTTREQLHP